MKQKKVALGVVFILSVLFTFSISTASSATRNADPLPTQGIQPELSDAITQAVLTAVAQNSRYQQAKMVPNLQVTDIRSSQDQQWGTAWVVYYDSLAEALLPSEPALAITHWVGNTWQVVLPSDSDWQAAMEDVPEDLLTKSEKDMWVAMNQGVSKSVPTQSGYFLPWHGGQTAYLSRSVGHDADYTTAHYAFDFYVPGTTVCPGGGETMSGTEGLNFNLYASKSGTVWGWEDTVENCDHSDVNFLVLRNIDDPTIFQLYLHLAQDSIPDALKTVGAPVGRGQFIGVADNTGASSGSHLHFQVEHQPYWPPENPYWSVSLDVTFEDVDINGGRPRVSPLDPPYCRDDDVCEVFRQTYVSNNYYQGDSTPPRGELSGVTTGQTVSSETITLSGWAADDESGLAYGQLKAYFGGSWHNLGPQFNPDFTYTWDLCDPGVKVENGPVSVAMTLYDLAGNPAPLAGLSHFIKNTSCPSPPTSCVPALDQITLFEDPNYQGGCVKFSPGEYPSATSLNPLGNDDADSILVGDHVILTLYSEENFSGHSQALINDQSYMNYQGVDANSLSSMKITPRTLVPQAPQAVSPLDATAFRKGDIIPLSWVNAGGAIDFRVELYKNGSLIATTPWQIEPFRYVESLTEGAYSWRVQGRNPAGSGTWSELSTFSVESPIVFPPPQSIPYSDSMDNESLWVYSSGGLWNYKNDSTKARTGAHSWWYQNNLGNYDNNLPNHGVLTSPPISITSSGYYLRFFYKYETETQGKTWDQRWVQISVDQEPFINLLQLSDDPQMPETSSWLLIKPINLSPYTGHVIRIRFQFSTLDDAANNYSGWGIDDFSITAAPPDVCNDNRQDDTPAQAFLLTYDPSITLPGEICPNGDYDFYKFYGYAGDQIAADIDAMANASLLDAYLSLLDSDGKTVIAENDDEVYAQIRDPLLNYTLPHDGFYYLKLRAWKHPLIGGEDYFYNIRLFNDGDQPIADLPWPATNSYLPDANMIISVDVIEPENAINRAEFYWHSTDWFPGEWDLLGIDRDGSDGWQVSFDPTGQPEGKDAAIFIAVYDMAGNFTGVGAWNLGIDKTAPNTAMQPLDATQTSSAFRLAWTASDNLSGIDFLEIQEKINFQDWTTFPLIDEGNSYYWIIGIPGNAYAYRMHAVDHSGNIENYPTSAEVNTTVPPASVLCNLLDAFESSTGDNSPLTASTILADGGNQLHNFCNPLSPDFQNDEDWIQLSVTQGKDYFIHSHAESLQTGTVIELYGQDGTTLIAASTPRQFGFSTYLQWTSDRDGTVYLRLRHVDSRVIGTSVASTVSVSTGDLSFIPLIAR